MLFLEAVVDALLLTPESAVPGGMPGERDTGIS